MNSLGDIVRQEWFRTAVLRSNVELFDNEFMVMPNHIHGIIRILDDEVGARRRRAPTEEQFGKPAEGSLPTIIRSFKSAVTYRANHELKSAKIWQKNYYEHIIRDQTDYERIAGYILTNPENWDVDEENPTQFILLE